MRIITYSCPQCGTVIAGNVLERRRLLKCPGINCEREIRFTDLSEDEQAYLENHRKRFRME